MAADQSEFPIVPPNPMTDSDDSGCSIDRFPPIPHPIRQPFKAAYWLFDFLFGIASLWALLALLASIPVLNFVALGYLLDAQGRVARTGKLRNGMPLLNLAPRLGGIVAGCWFWWWIVRQVADAASDANLIAPDTTTARTWQLGLQIVSILVTIHLILAIARGGRLGHFFWPTPLNALWFWKRLGQGHYFEESATTIRQFLSGLKLRHHFWLGLRGFAFALVWLVVPTALFSALTDTSKPGQILATFLGGVMLTFTLAWVPFLQARFAAENRWRAMFELRDIKECYRRAPVVMVLAVIVLYALSLPLYLFKVAALPKDTYWLLTPIFIFSIYPARILIGWAYYSANNRKQQSSIFLRSPLWIVRMVVLGLYVFVLFFTPTIGAAGKVILYQHHGILLPWPY